MRPRPTVTSPRKLGELHGVGGDPGHRLGDVVEELPADADLLDHRALGIAAPLHLLDEDAEALGGAGVMGAKSALLPSRRRPLQKHGAGGVDLGDAGDVHLAGEFRGRRDWHPQALQRNVEPGGFDDRPGAAGDQAKRRASEFDTEPWSPRLRREA